MSLYVGGATSDVMGAFLLAPWPPGLAKYAVHPPRLLIEMGHAQEGEAWLPQRPLYGIREAPAIWAKFRSERMSGAKIPFGKDFIILQPSLVDPELWLVYNVDGETQEGSFVISQGYILDLVRSYSMEKAIGAKLPCPKEWLVEEEFNPDNDENFSEEELKSAQRIVGQQLSLAMRIRPDILYILNFMSSRVARQALEVLRVGRRVLAYLPTTSNLPIRSRADPMPAAPTTHSLATTMTADATQAAPTTHSTSHPLEAAGMSCTMHKSPQT